MKTELQFIYEGMSAKQWSLFAFIEANFQHILGSQSFEQNFVAFQQLNQYSDLYASASPRSAFSQKNTDSCLLKKNNLGPCIWLSFHFGSYRSIPIRLIQQGRPVCILLSKSMLSKYVLFYQKILKDLPVDTRVTFQIAEDPKLYFKLKSFVHQGYDLFVFADGARGTVNDLDMELSKVNLVKGSLFVRSGYIKIAQLLKLPLWLILDRSTHPEILQPLLLQECYIPSVNAEKDIDLEYVLSIIFQEFGKVLKANPMLWEAWHYLHRGFRPFSTLEQWQQKRRVIPLKPTDKLSMLDKYTYRIHQLSFAQHDKLIRHFFDNH